MRLVILPALASLLCGCAILSQPDYRAETADPPTADAVDLTRYAGLWHEIARYPNWFEKGCTETTAEYTLREDGKIGVLNSCIKEGSGKLDTAKGTARPVEGSNNTKLKVKFIPDWLPFGAGDYWVLHLEPDYSAALIGTPSGKYLWILAREKGPDPAVIDRILAKAEALGYETDPLKWRPDRPN